MWPSQIIKETWETVLLKGLLLKVAILAQKKSEKKSKNIKTTEKTIHAFQNEFNKTQKNKQEKTEQIHKQKQT